MKLRLIEPSIDIKKSYLDYITEWEISGETIVPFASRRNNMSFEDLMINWDENKTEKAYEKGFVPATLYFLVDDTNRIIGSLHFRHELNEKLLVDGGHIGYGIRPSEREKGYACYMLGLALRITKEKGYKRVLVTCDQVNMASARTIEKNGGLLENIVDVDGELTRRYWIELE